jgi:DNA polymerase-4
MKLTDLPGIATANEKRLLTVGIRTPYDIRHGSEALLRRAFGGIVGNYWYRRLNFIETDIYQNDYRGMSAGRTLSRQQRESPQALESLFISLCTRLEQRLVKQNVFCKEINLHIRYHDIPGWKTKVRLNHPIQDALEMRQYLKQRVDEFEKNHGSFRLFNNKVQHIGVSIADFVRADRVEYGLFENKLQEDTARKVLYEIKDVYGKNIVRKASEIVNPHEMRDAIGFGSVKDLYINADALSEGDERETNKYLLEDDSPEAAKEKLTPLEAKEQAKRNPKLPQNIAGKKEDTNYYEMSDNKWEGIDMLNEYVEEFAA